MIYFATNVYARYWNALIHCAMDTNHSFLLRKYWPVCVKPSDMLKIAKSFVHFSLPWQCGSDSVAFLKHVFAFCVLFIHILHQNIPTTMTIIIKRNHIMELTRCEMFVFLIWSDLVLWLNCQWYQMERRTDSVVARMRKPNDVIMHQQLALQHNQ